MRFKARRWTPSSREARPRYDRCRLSALIWGGTPYKLIEAAAAGDIELVTSPALLAELRDVVGREHLASRLAAQRPSAQQAIGFYGELAINVSPLSTPHVVSGGRHLLSMGSYQGIGIANAAEAVRRVEKAKSKT